MKTQLFAFAIVLFVIAGCSKSLDDYDISVTVSDEYQKNDMKVIDVAVQNRNGGSGTYVYLFFITNNNIPPGSVASFYDKNDRVLRKEEVDESLAKSSYKMDNPSFQYFIRSDYLDARLIHKIIIGQP